MKPFLLRDCSTFCTSGRSFLLATVLLVWWLLPVTVMAASGYRLPLRASTNNRYLVDQSGTPFLIMGDSPQSMVVNLDASDMQN
jgi:hypothetical protein